MVRSAKTLISISKAEKENMVWKDPAAQITTATIGPAADTTDDKRLKFCSSHCFRDLTVAIMKALYALRSMRATSHNRRKTREVSAIANRKSARKSENPTVVTIVLWRTFCEISIPPIILDITRDAVMSPPTKRGPTSYCVTATMGAKAVPTDPPSAVPKASRAYLAGTLRLSFWLLTGFGTTILSDAKRISAPISAISEDITRGESSPKVAIRAPPTSGNTESSDALAGVIILEAGRERSPPEVTPTRAAKNIAG